MSAIAGIVRFDGAPVEADAIDRLTMAMQPRGPDAQAHWRHDGVALGHCLLRTTPESAHERQPLHSRDGNFTVVLDGRLDNREELAHELKAHGITPLDNSNAALVLGAYEAWGRKSPGRLLGDFVFAIHDARRNKLFVARDHVGARPLYYSQNDHFFAFASDDEALLELAGVSRQPSEEMIAYLLCPAFTNPDGHQSWLRDVRLLPPAHSLSAATDGSFRIDEYWKLEPGQPADFANPEEYLEAFLEIFAAAVHCRMRAAGGLATMLSGGLDSASIAFMVDRQVSDSHPTPFNTYSVVSDDPDNCIETRSVHRISRHVRNRPHEFSLSSLIGGEHTDELIAAAWRHAHPVDNAILIPALICRIAGRNDHRVLLHGVSGDITTRVPGDYIKHLIRDGQWRKAWNESRHAAQNNIFLENVPPLKTWLRAAWSARAPEGMQQSVRRWRLKPVGGSPDIFRPEFEQKLKIGERLQARAASLAQRGNESQAAEQVRSLANPVGGLECGLTGFEHAAGHHGVELRDPWADRRLVEFFLNLPLEQKIHDGWTKALVRAAAEPAFGREVTRRVDKTHLGWPLVSGLMSVSRSFIDRCIQQDLERIQEIIDTDLVRTRYRSWLDTGNDQDCEFTYTVVTLLAWLNRIDP